MKREILTKKRSVSDCCPGHDQYPAETYRNNRSVKARARDKKLEHQHARTLGKRETQADKLNHDQEPDK